MPTAIPTPRLADDRVRLNAGEVRWPTCSTGHGLVLDASEVFLFSHWLTPEGAPRRYDTWFLVAPAPEGQEGSHDDAELVHSEWVRPARRARPVRGGRSRPDLPDAAHAARARVVRDRGPRCSTRFATRTTVGRAPPLVVPDASGQRIALTPDDARVAVPGWRSLTSRPDLDIAGLIAEEELGLANRQGVA